MTEDVFDLILDDCVRGSNHGWWSYIEDPDLLNYLVFRIAWHYGVDYEEVKSDPVFQEWLALMEREI